MNFLVLMFLLATLQVHSGDDVKLVNTKTGFVVVEFREGRALFHDKILEAELKELGIFIPPVARDEFDGKKVVFPGDALFEKAFIEVYCRYTIANPAYQWFKD